MAFDFKKEYKEFYLPKGRPEIVTVPPMNYLAVRGKGDPNVEGGPYKQSIALLYALAYTLKMSHMGPHKIDGYFPYVVPPLEGFWWQEDGPLTDKAKYEWLSVIRLPDFVTRADFDWAVTEVNRKKGLDTAKAEMWTIEEGLCVQCMHIGSYDEETPTLEKMRNYAEAEGYVLDLNDPRRHHEIYLSDARKVAPEKRKTVLRLPIKEKG